MSESENLSQHYIRLETYERCPICNSNEIQIAQEHIEAIWLEKYKFVIYMCNKCHVNFSNPAPVADDIPKLYQENSIGLGGKGKKTGLVSRLRQFRAVFYANKIFYGLDNLDVLDFGCGDGLFAYFLKQKSKTCSSVYASDFSKIPPELIANENMYIPLEQLNEKQNSFDYVFARHVLEHIKNPREFIDSLTRLLKPDGKLVIDVPRYNNIWDKIFKSYSTLIGSMPYHLFFFTPQSFSNIFSHKFDLIFKRSYVPVLGSNLIYWYTKKKKMHIFGLFAAICIIPEMIINLLLCEAPAMIIIMKPKKDVIPN